MLFMLFVLFYTFCACIKRLSESSYLGFVLFVLFVHKKTFFSLKKQNSEFQYQANEKDSLKCT